jgi:hypothetical protein
MQSESESEPAPLALLLDVPLVEYKQTVNSAIQDLARTRRSALLVDGPNQSLRLFHAVDLYRARAEKIPSVGEMSGSEKFVGVAIPELTDPERNEIGAEAIPLPLRQSNAPLALVRRLPESGSGTVLVVSQSLFNEIKSGPADCYCTGPRKHPFPPPSVQTGDVCPFDGHPIFCKV